MVPVVPRPPMLSWAQARRMLVALGVPFHDHCRSIASIATGEGPFVAIIGADHANVHAL